MSGKENIPSSYFCYPTGNQGIYVNSDSTLIVMFSCVENFGFAVSTISCSSETDLLSQLFASVMTVKTLENIYADPTLITNEAIELAYKIYKMKNGETYTCDEFTVQNVDGNFIFAL
jgi:hypothetical protein